jgi:hypothetical protein
VGTDVDHHVAVVEGHVPDAVVVLLEFPGHPLTSLRSGLVVREKRHVIDLVVAEHTHDPTALGALASASSWTTKSVSSLGPTKVNGRGSGYCTALACAAASRSRKNVADAPLCALWCASGKVLRPWHEYT